ncbi:MAG: DUF1361 domain-containing protein [Spirochaetes bacterium]|nr:DUF1361 domain-containing protein [Spirochaetota bacterium]
MLEKYHYKVFQISRIIQLTLSLLLASIGCSILLIVRMKLTGSIQYSFLIRNLVLAWIPYFIALFIKYFLFLIKVESQLKIFVSIFSLVWLIFFPNSSYIVTDFIYILKFPFFIPDKSFFTSNTLIWFDIILSSSFAFIGHIIGLISLLMMHTVFDKFMKKLTGWFIIVISVFLSGYGIFLGRFIRLNSWDIFHKTSFVLIQILSNLISLKAILFSSAVGFFIFLTYIIIYYIYFLRR